MVQKFWSKLVSEEDFFILDLRSHADYQLCHFPKSLFCNSIAKANQLLKDLNKSKPVLLVDYGSQKQAENLWDQWQAQRPVFLYKGGYASLVKRAKGVFTQKINMICLAGKTGSGKTETLHLLAKKGIQVVDLESIAKSKGSVFAQKQAEISQTQFELNLALALRGVDFNKPCLVEREGIQLGGVFLPQAFFKQLHKAPSLWLERSIVRRVEQIQKDFKHLLWQDIKLGVEKLKPSLSAETLKALTPLLAGKKNRKRVIKLLMHYYDATPGYQKPPQVLAKISAPNPKMAATAIVNFLHKSSH
jgi:tRNA 2-selenouridine synthase